MNLRVVRDAVSRVLAARADDPRLIFLDAGVCSRMPRCQTSTMACTRTPPPTSVWASASRSARSLRVRRWPRRAS